jgi:hypothetical protein
MRHSAGESEDFRIFWRIRNHKRKGFSLLIRDPMGLIAEKNEGRKSQESCATVPLTKLSRAMRHSAGPLSSALWHSAGPKLHSAEQID